MFPRSRYTTVAAFAAAGLVASALAAGPLPPASAATLRPAAAQTPASAASPALSSTAQPGGTPSRWFNVGAAHSPKLLHMLAGATTSGQTGSMAPATSLPAPSGLKGVDVAAFQHPNGEPIDWAQVAAAGYKYAFIKATEGSYYINPYYASDRAQAEAAGIIVAGYHFANPSYSSGALQADYALNASDYAADGQTLPFIVDLEYDPYSSNECYGLSPAQMVSWIGAFTAEIKRRTGQTTIIYTTADWWNKCTGSSTAFGADPVWVAAYDTSTPALPVGWNDYAYWQYTSTATVPGIAYQGHVDVSTFDASLLSVARPATQSYAGGLAVSVPVNSLNAAAGSTLTHSASLPSGLTVDPSSGLISGTLPATPTSYSGGVTVQDTTTGASQVLPLAWKVHGPVQVRQPSAQSTPAGEPANLSIASTDGLSGCSLTFSATGLPPGLAISPCGKITGWTTRPGSSTVTVTATDSSGQTLGSVTFGWQVSMPVQAASGRIRLAIGKLCLARPNGRTTIADWTCQKTSGQIWQYFTNNTLRLNRRCLAAQAVKGGGTRLALAKCNRSDWQDWQYQAGGQLVNGATGLCLADLNGTDKAGTPAVLAACDGSAAQSWTLPPGPLLTGQPGRCLVAAPPASGKPARLYLGKCQYASDQSWTLRPDGELRVIGRCLTAQTPMRSGATAVLAYCKQTVGMRARQHWQPLTEVGGTFLINSATGLCLAILPRSTATTAVRLGHCMAWYPRLTWLTS